MREEHPGPPFIHKITGSFTGSFWLDYYYEIPCKEKIMKCLAIISYIEISGVNFSCIIIGEAGRGCLFDEILIRPYALSYG
jgi:hypothetical protein